jgi:hypothetical protein
MPRTPAAESCRIRLLRALHGRSLEDAFRRPEVRRDLLAEATEDRPDALITREQFDHVDRQIARKCDVVRSRRLSTGPRAAPRGLFTSDQKAIIVPGFLGSELSDVAGGHGLIWISPRSFFGDLLGYLRLAPYDDSVGDQDLHSDEVQIAATGALPLGYGPLRLGLSLSQDVEYFPVDWRRDLEIISGNLAERIRSQAGGRWEAIHVIAHSQGALVARRALQMLSQDDDPALAKLGKLVLIGPANYGTFAAALAIGGGQVPPWFLRILPAPTPADFQAILASMSGLYQLLPWDSSRIPWLAAHDLKDPDEIWKGRAETARLNRFVNWGAAIDTSFHDANTLVILGDLGFTTPGGVTNVGGVVVPEPGYFMAGDGTIPHACAVLPGAVTRQLQLGEHATLPLSPLVIATVAGYLDENPLIPLDTVSSDPGDYLDRRELVSPRGLAPRAAAPANALPAGADGAQGDAAMGRLIDLLAGGATRSGSKVRIIIEVEPGDR